MNDCLFCKIISKEITSECIFENKSVYAFRDINPQAPVHALIIPKIHVASLNELSDHHKDLVGEIILTSKMLAENLGISEAGYRTIFNCNDHGGQEVYHLHLHLLGGRQMLWPPG